MDTPPPEPPEHNPYEPPHAPTVRPQIPATPGASFLANLLAVIGVVLASLIAFVATCLPAGFAGVALGIGQENFIVPILLACIVGFFVAGLVGFALSRWIRNGRRVRAALSQDQRESR